MSWRESWWLVLRAYGWLMGVTLPAATLLTVAVITIRGAVVPDSGVVSEPLTTAVPGALLGVLLIELVAAPCAFAATVASWPITWLVGRLLRGVRSDRVQIGATSVLAGLLGAVSLGAWGWPAYMWGPLALAAGTAGALARRGEFVRSARLLTMARQSS